MSINSCAEIAEIFTDYLEGHLSIAQRLRFQFHLGMCRHCRAYLRQMKVTIETLIKLRHEVIPRVLPQEMLQRLRDWGG